MVVLPKLDCLLPRWLFERRVCGEGKKKGLERKTRLVRANNGLPIIGLGLWPAFALLHLDNLINFSFPLDYFLTTRRIF